MTRPTPHGVGGLKLLRIRKKAGGKGTSHPSRGGWIEIIWIYACGG